MAELRPNIVFHGRHFVRHLGVCTPICVKLLQVMSCVIPRNLKQNGVSISNRFPEVHKRRIHTHTDRHTHTHTHLTIAEGEMQCVAFRLKSNWNCFFIKLTYDLKSWLKFIILRHYYVHHYCPSFLGKSAFSPIAMALAVSVCACFIFVSK